MTEYMKIDTLWKRDMSAGKKKGVIIEGDFSNPIFPNIVNWRAVEKIDGTNIRVMWDADTGTVTFAGRTSKSEIPAGLLAYLQSTFTPDTFNGNQNMVIYGEGCGPKIHNSQKYLVEDKYTLIVFDIKIGEWWLEHETVVEVAAGFGLRYAPSVGIMTIPEIIELVKAETKSIAATSDSIFEGIVATPEPMVLDRSRKPVKFKLKAEDFRKLKAVKGI